MLKEKLKILEGLAMQAERPEDFFNQIFVVSQDIILNNDYAAAYRLVKIVDSAFSKTLRDLPSEQVKKLENLAIKLKFLSLSKWPESVILNLFSAGIGQLLGDEVVDVYSRLEAALIELPIHLRDEFKQKLLRRLSDNKEKLASIKIEVNDVALPATIGNLIRDYLSRSKSEQSANIKFAQYIESKIFRGLNDIEKRKVKELFAIFTLLSRSTYDPEGLENAILYVDLDNKMKILDHGMITVVDEEKNSSFPVSGAVNNRPLTPTLAGSVAEPSLSMAAEPDHEFRLPASSGSMPSSDVSNEVMVAYRGDDNQLKAITKEIDKLTGKFGSDTVKLRQEFFGAVQNRNVARTIAILRLLVQLRDLENFIKEDEKLGKFLAATWAKQYGADFAAGFKKNSAQPKYVRAFLRYILEQRLGLAVSDAARVGLQIGNIFVSLGKTSYNKMAYFNVADKNFEWFD